MKMKSLPIPAMKSVEGTQPIRKHSPIPLQNMVEQKKPTQQQRQVVAYYVSSQDQKTESGSVGEGRPDFRSGSEVPTKEDSLVLFKILIQDLLFLYIFFY